MHLRESLKMLKDGLKPGEKMRQKMTQVMLSNSYENIILFDSLTNILIQIIIEKLTMRNSLLLLMPLIYCAVQARVSYSPATWMRDLSANCDSFGDQLITDLLLPGAHHAGLTTINPTLPLLEQIAAEVSNNSPAVQQLFSTVPVDTIILIAQNQGVTQVTTVTQELNMGCRFFDIRLLADFTNPNEIYLAHLFPSSIQFFTSLLQKQKCFKAITLQSVLIEFRNFMRSNPKEIIIILIRSDTNYLGEDGNPVNLSIQDALLQSTLLDSNRNSLLLDRSHLLKPIRKYGGIFIGGQTNLATINILDGWPVTQSATPQTVIKAINDYYFKEEYIQQIKQTPGGYDLIMSKRKLQQPEKDIYFNFIVTATSQTSYTSIIYEATVSQGLNVEPDLVKRALLDPGNLLAVAPLTNQLMIKDIQKYCILFELLQAVIIDDFNQDTANALINFNIERLVDDSSSSNSSDSQ